MDVRDVLWQPCDNVVSVSVMQFIGDNGYGNEVREGPEEAIDVIESIVDQSASCLLTWPNGYNASLDDAVFSGYFDEYISFMERDENNDWLQVGVPMLRLYGFPFKKGNSICVLRA